jgi:hypothetical protein
VRTEQSRQRTGYTLKPDVTPDLIKDEDELLSFERVGCR